MRISIKSLEEVEGGVVLVALLKCPTCLYPPSKISPNRSNDENVAAYEEELEMMEGVRREFGKEDAGYTHIHLGDAELIQEDKMDG